MCGCMQSFSIGFKVKSVGCSCLVVFTTFDIRGEGGKSIDGSIAISDGEIVKKKSRFSLHNFDKLFMEVKAAMGPFISRDTWFTDLGLHLRIQCRKYFPQKWPFLKSRKKS